MGAQVGRRSFCATQARPGPRLAHTWPAPGPHVARAWPAPGQGPRCSCSLVSWD